MGEPAEVAGVELPDALVHLPDVPLQVLLRVEPLGALVAVVVELVRPLRPLVAPLVEGPVLVVNHLAARRAHLPLRVVLPESVLQSRLPESVLADGRFHRQIF